MKTPFPKYNEALVLEIEEYLCQNSNTEIQGETEYEPDSEMAGLSVFYVRGKWGKSDTYVRPMFQVINDNSFPAVGPRGLACACGNFSRSWNCAEHGEVPWDWEKRQFVTPGTSTRPRPTPAGTSTRPGEEIPLTLAGQVIRYVPGCPCPMCDPGAPVALARRLMGLDRISITVEGVFDEGGFSYEAEQDVSPS